MKQLTYHFIKKKILIFNVAVMATAFSPFIGDGGINNFLIGFMIFSIYITLGNFIKLYKKDWAIYLLPFTLLISGILHISSFRPSSYLYGLLFILFFIENLHLIRYSQITIYQYQNLIKILIYSYFFVLITQQVMYLVGIENFFNKIFATGFKFNALATEPSYAATILVFLFYSYIKNMELIRKETHITDIYKKEKILWFVFIYQMLTFGSSFGILYIFILILAFIKKPIYLIGIILISILSISIAIKIDFIPLLRIFSVLDAINFSSDGFSDLVAADHSASIRIIPFIYFIKTLDFYTLFGKGTDFSAIFFPTIIPGINDATMGGGLLPSFIIDNGIINFLLLIIVIFTNGIKKFFSFTVLALIITLLNTSFNSQLFWLIITLLTLNKHFAITLPAIDNVFYLQTVCSESSSTYYWKSLRNNH